ncbi:MAG: hypothetical protein QOI55_2058 [Actinomycetota bacterium]|nr:hypothetical protein [Actinomycetota bacterium]
MVASVHLADLDLRSAFRALRRAPSPDSTPGLRHADVAVAAPLRGAGLPAPQFRRIGLVAFWDDDDALDRFEAEHPLASTLASGWHVRLAPLRAFGSWPGLADDVPSERAVDHDGPAVVLTLARLRLTQAPRFIRTSGRAERATYDANGLIWATALARPPFVATCSLWRDTRSLSTYAYGARERAHPDAIAADRRKPFHHQSAFVRFRPYDSGGSLAGRNPLTAA